ncbi:MAG: OmpA family protein [Bacteroidota bacterium]
MKILRTLLPFIVLSLVMTFQAHAQQKKTFTQEADQAFEDKMFNLAIEKYEKAYSKVKKNRIEKNRILFQIAESYRLTNNWKKAEQQYKRLDKANYQKINPIVIMYYADAQKINERYEDAIIQYKRYADLAPNDPRGKIGIESCQMAQTWKDNPTRYAVNPSDEAHKELNAWKTINSKEDDFAPSFAEEKGKTMVFTSSRENSTGGSVDDWTGQAFSDLYVSTMSSKGDWSTPVLLDDQNVINTDGNEGASCYSNKFNTLYFTRCSSEKKKVLTCAIYRTERRGKIWSPPEHVKLGTDSTKIYGHPAVSKDELTIYFASDMEGGQGGKDIWVATRAKKNKNFDLPKNLGTTINTPGDEMFPYLRFDSLLYFASNYLPGMGGMDIFKTVKVGEKWSSPENMKSPVNSAADDFAVTFFPGVLEEKGYFASNRKLKSGKGGDDIYSFLKIPLLFTIQGVVKDDRTLQYIPGATVKMVGSDGTSIETKTDKRGGYAFDKTQVLPTTSYELTVSKEGYFSDKGRETTVGLEQSKDFQIDFVLSPIPVKPIVLPEILYDLAKWDLKPQYQDSLQGLITILEANPTMTIELGAHTDTRDTDVKNDTLSLKRAQSVVSYLISRGIDPDRLTASGYGERVPRVLAKDVNRDGFLFPSGTVITDDYIATLSGKPHQEAAHQLNRRTEFRILSMNFVPKAVIDTLAKGKIEVVTNPKENILGFNPLEGDAFEATIIVNGYSANFDYDKKATEVTVSPEFAFNLLTKGFISKPDFVGDASKALSEGSVADKAKINIKTMRIGDNTITNIEVVVAKDQKPSIKLGDPIFNKIGKWRIEKEKSRVVFE